MLYWLPMQDNSSNSSSPVSSVLNCVAEVANLPTKAGGTVPDVEAIMASIRAEVRQRLESEGRTGVKQRGALPIEPDRNPELPLIDYEELNYMNAHFHDWVQMQAISSHRPVVGRLIVWVKTRLIHLLLNSVLHGYFDKERQFHIRLVKYLNANARYVDNRDYRNFWQLIEKVDKEIVALNERTDRLFDEAYTSVVALRRELEELKARVRSQ